MPQTTPAAPSEPAPNPPPRNPAVERCCAARDRSLLESRAGKRDTYDTKSHAAQAYMAAMPDLADYENIRDFIACISHGMVIGVVHPIEAPRFLYAAQVAIGALRLAPKDQKRPAA
jgi:hypothetical protein